MVKHKISVVRESSKAKYSARNGGEFRKEVVKPVTWFDSSRFKFASESQKKRIVLNFLRNVRKEDVECKPDFGRKERVIVNVKGRYAIEEAVFDRKIKLPSNLVDEKKKGVRGVLSG